MKRIVSLLPSATEIVHLLGQQKQLVGRSHECDYPVSITELPVCTSPKVDTGASSGEMNRQVESLVKQGVSLYNIDTDKLRALRPNLILTQTQCEVCAVSEDDVKKALENWPGNRPQVITLSPQRLADVWTDMQHVADALEMHEEGRTVIKTLKNCVVDVVEKRCALTRHPSVACIEWLDPLMAAGNWVPELVDLAGGLNLFGEAGKHSPWLNWEAVTEHDPEVIVVMPCGFDITRMRKEISALIHRPDWTKLRAVKKNRVYLADGNSYFNRPGPRLVESLEILAEIIHPEKFNFGHEGKGWEKL